MPRARVASRKDRQIRHVLALGLVAMFGMLGHGLAVLPSVRSDAALLLTGVLPVLAGVTAYFGLTRPALRDSDGAAATLRAERDGARDRLARLKAELDRSDNARGFAETARAEAEAEAAAKADYLATISREVRTPLTGVIGMAELLAETRLDDEQTALVGTVRQSAEVLKFVLADVTDFAALEAGDTVLEDAPFDMREVAREALAEHVGAARTKGVELVFDAAPTLMTQSRGDARRVGRMISVLVGNAVKFTERGEVVLRLASRDRGGQPEVTVEVIDTGVGIGHEDQGHVFEPFFRGDDTASERYGGTGLGLAIAVRLARLMAGRIDMRSTPGEGSTFTLSFAHRMRQTARGGAQGPDLSGRRYLVIDDSSAARAVLERQLAHWGAEFVAAESAEEGEDLLWESLADGGSFDAVLLDTTLSGADGAALAARLGEKVAGVPVILLCAGDPKAAFAAVADGVAAAQVQKPFDPAALVKALRSAEEAGVRHAGSSGAPAAAPETPLRLAPACIVLADDNAANRILIEKFLSDEPMTLIHAPDGVGAVEAWADWAPDLILMDVSMPRMDGLEATRRIRVLERTEGLVRVPIIALTAKAMADDREKCLEAGMDDYVAKPIRKADLKSKITEWTRSRLKTA